MSFLDTVAQAKTYLREHERVSLRGLEREFDFDDHALDELVDELVNVQQVAARKGRMLVWIGPAQETIDGTTPTTPAKPDAAADGPSQSIPATQGERRHLTVVFL